MDKIIHIYINFEKEYFLGTLFIENKNGKDYISFEYSYEFLNSDYSKIQLDPELSWYSGRQYSKKNLFGFLDDSCPDRWGRILFKRRELEKAKIEHRKARSLTDVDFLLGVYDESRMGSLRFKEVINGPYLQVMEKDSIPPWIYLRALEEYSVNFDFDETIDSDWIKNLLEPGSSLGGSRPKANVYDQNGDIWIAKFPKKTDTYDVGAWEAVVNELAAMCSLNVPDFKIEKFSKYGSTFLTKRFDRDNGRRIHFISSMTALSARDGESENYSYIDIVNYIKENSTNPKEDSYELYKRVIFNMAINNTDDHLRNHGFLIKDKNSFRLSPLYDINPSLFGENLSLCINQYDSYIDKYTVIETSKYYDINKEEAILIYNNIVDIVNNNWIKIANKYNISKKSIDDMKTCFSLTKIE